MFTTISLQLTT